MASIRAYNYIAFLILLLNIFFSATALYGQNADSSTYFLLKGNVKDSLKGYSLPSSTVVAYQSDTSGNEFTLTDQDGYFSLKKLKKGVRLKILVTHVGYKTWKRDLNNVKDSIADLGTIQLVRSSEEDLEEVVVRSIIPVRMNGDTLEFNADAFKLPPNAVVEDLLRRLPGVTLWGDGTITVNGRKVQKVTVDGKPFFGGAAKIATQNLDKQTVDKIQVYNEENPNSVMDSITNINITLKRDKKNGFFGKSAGSIGTSNRFEFDLAANYFNPSLQAGLIGNYNNINRMSSDINVLFRNATFKGSGTNIDFLPKLDLPGMNVTKQGGYIFQYDFQPGVLDSRKKNMLESGYYLSNNKNNTNRERTSIFSYKKDSILVRKEVEQDGTTEEMSAFNIKYTKNTLVRKFNIDLRAKLQNSKINEKRSGDVYNEGDDLLSTNSYQNTGLSTNRSILLNASYDTRNNQHDFNTIKGFRINYSQTYDQNNAVLTSLSEVLSFVDSAENFSYNRQIRKDREVQSNRLNFSYENLSGLFDRYRATPLLRGYKINLETQFNYRVENEDDNVSDYSLTTARYETNGYLTNDRSLSIFEVTPSLNLGKSFGKTSANRFKKLTSLEIRVPLELRSDRSESLKEFQNYRRAYTNFIPSVNISYRNDQFGLNTKVITANFSSNIIYPILEQLAPLIDSANIYSLRFGNKNLDPSRRFDLKAAYKLNNADAKNDFSYTIDLLASATQNPIIQKSVISNSGRNLYTYQNHDKSTTTFVIGGSLNKSFKLKYHLVQVQLKSENSHTATFNIQNEETNRIVYLNTKNSLAAFYDFKTDFSLRITESFSYGEIKQSLINNSLNTLSNSFDVAVALNFLKDFQLISNTNYLLNRFSNRTPQSFVLLNASLGYRFLSKKNAELKLSVFDLFKQNKGIINISDLTGITTVNSNIIQQFGLITFIYYPRKFGKAQLQKSD